MIFEIIFVSNSTWRAVGIFILIGSVIFSILSILIIELKKRLGPFAKFFVPALISFIWLLIIDPYLVVIPLIASVLTNTSSAYGTFVEFAFAGTALLVIATVTFFAILINIFLEVSLFFESYHLRKSSSKNVSNSS
jgi:hypothetical protein